MQFLTAKDLRFVRPMRSLKYPDLEEVVIPLLADVQYWKQRNTDGSYEIRTVALDKLKSTIARISTMPNAYPFIGGDLLDTASPSNRSAYSSIKSKFYDSVVGMNQDKALEYIDDMVEILSPCKGKYLGMVSGHHFWEFYEKNAPKDVRGKNSDQVICERLGMPYLGEGMAMLHIPLTSGKNPKTARFLGVHPDGYGVTLMAAISKLVRDVLPYHQFDVAGIAHYHKKISASVPLLMYPESGGVREMSRKLVSMGSYSKTFAENMTTYGEKKMYAPYVLGSPIVYLRYVKLEDRIDIEIED